MMLTYLPKEKIHIEEEPQEGSMKETKEEVSVLFEALAKAGIDTASGMHFCQNDPEMYKSILSEYCSEQKNKLPNLENCYSSHDWKNYEIYIHSLKSTSKTIGANKLFEMASELEAAAGRGDELVIADGHGKAMELYRKIVRVIEENLDVEETGDVEEIFEFLPEENNED